MIKINQITEYLNQSIAVKRSVIENNLEPIFASIKMILAALKGGNTIYIAGNGGSAADAQHWAAEFVGRFQKERRALPVVALTTNTSIITAIGNDYGFTKIFSRQIEAFAQKGDVFIAVSTSGNSDNLIEALQVAKKSGVGTIALLGASGGNMKEMADISIIIDSPETCFIQEAHIAIEHLIVKLVEVEFV